MGFAITCEPGIDRKTLVGDSAESYGVVCDGDSGWSWILVNGFARRIDAEIALRYFNDEHADVLAVEDMPFDEAYRYVDEHEAQWMKEICERLQW